MIIKDILLTLGGIFIGFFIVMIIRELAAIQDKRLKLEKKGENAKRNNRSE